MNADNYVIHSFKTHFEQFKNKNIAIYGIGPKTELILEHFPDFNVIGLMDRYRIFGEIYGKPLLTYEDVLRLNVDIIIVVASKYSIKAVYDRIRDFCYSNQIPIYGINGRNLFDIFGSGHITFEGLKYFDKNEEELIEQINNHEIISFDVFDTLIMRKTLYPVDVFELVETRAKKKGIYIRDFKKIRIKSEIENPAPCINIYDIYSYFQELTGITDSEKKELVKLEIEVEKSVIIRREKMIELFFYAKKMGKKCYLISDMYLPRKVIEEILSNLGVFGYEDLYVSCEHGKHKGDGLFNLYKEQAKGLTYLHIGDNDFADGESAIGSEIDVYLIKSALNMMQLSTYGAISKYLKNINDRSLVGLLIARIFNNPFALHGTRGRPYVDQVKDAGYLFVGPLITNFVIWLINELKHNCYEDILFSARDGYLIQKLYEQAIAKLGLDNLPKGKYFLASRKLSTLASMQNDEDIIWLSQCYDEYSPQEMLKKRFDLRKEEILPYDQLKYPDRTAYALAHKEIIYKKSLEVRENYLCYTKKLGLEEGKSYALFDFCAAGTSQYFLAKSLPYDFEGLYLCRYYVEGNKVCDINARSLLVNNGKYNYDTYFSGHYLFLENVITSFSPSVSSMDQSGEPIYGPEKRSQTQLKFVEEMQDSIEEFFNDFIDFLYIEDQIITKDVSDMIFNLMDDAYTNENCKVFDEILLIDDMGSMVLDIDRKHWAG